MAEEFAAFCRVFLGSGPWPKPLHLLQGCELIESGAALNEAARSVGTTVPYLENVYTATNRLHAVLGISPEDLSETDLRKTRLIMGQLILGRCAEMAFEDLYKEQMQTQELELKDTRDAHTDTDYRVYNGQHRAVYRLNIKFHGARFRRAGEMVGLDPEDCFALATYKIAAGLQKESEENLPYIFAVVGNSALSGELVGEQLSDRTIRTVALITRSHRFSRKRAFEDQIVTALGAANDPLFSSTYDQIRASDWYILSVRRAHMLLQEKLFERVYALRVRGFAQHYRGAEVDMHFSLSRDMVPLEEFLNDLKQGPTFVATRMAKGEI